MQRGLHQGGRVNSRVSGSRCFFVCISPEGALRRVGYAFSVKLPHAISGTLHVQRLLLQS